MIYHIICYALYHRYLNNNYLYHQNHDDVYVNQHYLLFYMMKLNYKSFIHILLACYNHEILTKNDVILNPS